MGRDFEEGIGLERGTGQLVDKKDPRKAVGFRMEAGRTLLCCWK